jgi:hypothetical protein
LRRSLLLPDLNALQVGSVPLLSQPVDQHNILGLGPNTPLGTGNFSDAMYALTYGKVIELRVPNPMGFFAIGMEGPIDDPNTGWKGKGLWVTSGNRTPAHIEGVDAPSPGAPGKTLSSPLVVHFQLRPDPPGPLRRPSVCALEDWRQTGMHTPAVKPRRSLTQGTRAG